MSVGYVAGSGARHLDSARQGNGTDRTGPVEIEGRGKSPLNGLCGTVVHWRLECRFANGVTVTETDVSQQRMGLLDEGTEG